jgi:mannan endo-1,4-beta-mannosidase
MLAMRTAFQGLKTWGLAVMVLSAAPHAQAAEIVINGSFESNRGSDSVPGGWTVLGSPSSGLAVRSSTLRARTGVWSVHISGRASATDGLSQNVLAALRAEGTDRRRSCRLFVWLDDFASVRVFLRYADSRGQRPDVLLAERVVLDARQWVEVSGGSVVSWEGTLQSAAIRIEVQQLARKSTAAAPRLLPAYFLDGLTLDADTDGDATMDRDEAALGTDPASADTDGDGLPDTWERGHGLLPLVIDADQDPDDDGFSNVEEYWAATDPRAATSFPGKPANPAMNAQARAVLRWLALLPSRAPGAHLAVGQTVSDLGSPSEYDTMIDGLGDATGRWPALLSMAIESPYDRLGIPLQIAEAERRAAAYWESGGLVLMKWAVYNPWVQLNAGNNSEVDIPGLLDPSRSDPATRAGNQAAHDTLMGWMHTVGDSLARLQERGVVVLFRPCSEMNGGWFWWGHRERAEYVALWTFFFDYFTRTRGLNNLIWVYEGDAGTHAPSAPGGASSAADYYYPGDDRVDVMGHNLYSNTWELDWDANALFARYPKVYGIPQAGPGRTGRDGTFDNLIYAERSAAALPRSSFFIVWNSFMGADPVTGKASLQRLGIVDNRHAFELMHHPSIVTRELLAEGASERVSGTPTAPGSITPVK